MNEKKYDKKTHTQLNIIVRKSLWFKYKQLIENSGMKVQHVMSKILEDILKNSVEK